MTITSKSEVARLLRSEAESLRRHGFTNFFNHQYVCLLGQVVQPEQCDGCLLETVLPPNYKAEAFPCQHIDQTTWEEIVRVPELSEKVAERFLEIAAKLESQAEGKEPRPAGPTT